MVELKTVLLLLCLLCNFCSHWSHKQLLVSATEFVVEENLRNGTKDWWIPQPKEDPLIQGFTDYFSYDAGEEVVFKVDCPQLHLESYELRIYRLGYYQETGGRLVTTLHGIRDQCSQQPCMYEKTSRMVDCGNWKASLRWRSPHDQLSGVYVALPVSTDVTAHNNTPHYGGYIPFVIRPDPNRKYDILFKTSDLTWVAYNKFGGWNVYGGNGSKAFSTRASKASYNRPFANRLIYPIGQQQNFLFSTEFPMLYWLEKHGYDVAYASCADIEKLHEKHRLHPSFVKTLLSVGHDEYWTPMMKVAYTAARDHGVHLAFFSGNEMFWRVLWDEEYRDLAPFSTHLNFTNALPIDRFHRPLLEYNSTEQLLHRRSHRVFVCRKETIEDVAPPSAQAWTGTFVDPRHRIPTPENALTGQRFMVNSYRNDSLVVPPADAKLRFWRFASVVAHSKQHSAGSPATAKQYRSPPGVLGYELDGFLDDYFRPPGLITLSNTPLFINKSIVQDYGAAYGGSGSMSHRLVMYRHHIATRKSITSNSGMKACQVREHLTYNRSSLVFGAGTIQWSWALSSFRDGDAMPEDANLQQATINIFADMDIFPARLITKVTKSHRAAYSKTLNTQPRRLHLAKASADQLPPVSAITNVRIHANRIHMAKNNISLPVQLLPYVTVRLAGTAVDAGKGKVASVEVSVNGGRSWQVASGRERWSYTFTLFAQTKNTAPNGFYQYNASYGYPVFDADVELQEFRDALIHSRTLYDEQHNVHWYKANDTLHVVAVTRAVDDSGWIEKTGVNIEQTLCSLKRGEGCSGARHNCTLPNNIRILRFKVV